MTKKEGLTKQKNFDGMFGEWFIDYASYVILERAIPAIEDGLKPVQRRILHALKEMDDGRLTKAANVIGQTMLYHPHGDQPVSEALVNLGQKNLLLDIQGNWGDVRTGDSAAAARYIEVRLSKFALDILFNPQITRTQLSYDGRKNEPITFPAKFPLLVAQGVEGIAVGLSTKILPHNFIEILETLIGGLQGKTMEILPDFSLGGSIDVTHYNDGKRGGRIRIRATIEEIDSKTLVIKEIPHGTTTNSIIESVLKANDSGKIKIKKIIDNTAEDVEIQIQLAPGVSAGMTIDALYAFTDCEISVSPNACVIFDEKPQFIGVSDLLRFSNEQTVAFLKQELDIRKGELLEKLLYSSLEKIFIEKRIYRTIEECQTFEEVIQTVEKGLEPYVKEFYRPITHEDILKLLEIKIKRISKYDSFKADELMQSLEKELIETEANLAKIIPYTITFYKNLLKKYGKNRERKTKIRSFNTIEAQVVAIANQKLYVNREDGFIGFGLKKDEYVCDCSDLDDIIVFRKDGRMLITKIQEKVFVGKDILYCGVFKKNDERMIFNYMYLDGSTGISYAKRFKVMGITRDKEYVMCKENPRSKVLYLTANPNGEAEIVSVHLTATSSAKIKQFDFNFSTQPIKGRDSIGNIVTKYPIRKIVFKSEGSSTLGGLDLWYDEGIQRLNKNKVGKILGNFLPDDLILSFYENGSYELTYPEFTHQYTNALAVEKFSPEQEITVLYQNGKSKAYFLKRFKIETSTQNKKFLCISEEKKSVIVGLCVQSFVSLEIYQKNKKNVVIKSTDIETKNWKAIGQKIDCMEVVEVLFQTKDEQTGLF